MKRAELGQVVRYKDALCEVVAIGEGRSITIRPIRQPACRHCGATGDAHLLEHAPLFQNEVLPVDTISSG